jgi:death on curing protein
MSLDPFFLELEDVLLIHSQQLEKYGGSLGIRDQGLLESAIAQPQAGFSGQYVHNGLFEMAAVYAFHIAENQPFVDGNKRTALASALVFLDLNGIDVTDTAEKLYQAMIDISSRKLDKLGLAHLLESLSNTIS